MKSSFTLAMFNEFLIALRTESVSPKVLTKSPWIIFRFLVVGIRNLAFLGFPGRVINVRASHAQKFQSILYRLVRWGLTTRWLEQFTKKSNNQDPLKNHYRFKSTKETQKSFLQIETLKSGWAFLQDSSYFLGTFRSTHGHTRRRR